MPKSLEEQLYSIYETVDDRIRDPSTGVTGIERVHLERLHSDLEYFYIGFKGDNKLEIPDNKHKIMVMDVIRDRFRLVPNFVGQLTGNLKAFIQAGFTMPDIYFGQLAINTTFADSRVGTQDFIRDFPDVNGKDIETYATRLITSPDQSDLIPVKIFFDSSTGRWVASNNRGFAAHCFANVRPRRLFPCKPTSKETHRLNEYWGSKDIAGKIKVDFKFKSGSKFSNDPTELPAKESAMAAGSSNQVEKVVVVPQIWRH